MHQVQCIKKEFLRHQKGQLCLAREGMQYLSFSQCWPAFCIGSISIHHRYTNCIALRTIMQPELLRGVVRGENSVESKPSIPLTHGFNGETWIVVLWQRIGIGGQYFLENMDCCVEL